MYRSQLDSFPLKKQTEHNIQPKKGFEKTFHIQKLTLANLKMMSSPNNATRECTLIQDAPIADTELPIEQTEPRAESRIENVYSMCSPVATNSFATINTTHIFIVIFLYVKWLMIIFLVPKFNEFMQTICFIWVWIPVLFIQCSALYDFPYVAVAVLIVYSILSLQLYLVITFSYNVEHDNYFFIFHMCYQCALYCIVRQRSVLPVWLFVCTALLCVVVRTVTFNDANVNSFTGTVLCQTVVTILYNSFMFILAVVVLVDTPRTIRSKEDGKEW
jgi:hypothetical protein